MQERARAQPELPWPVARRQPHSALEQPHPALLVPRAPRELSPARD
jgi:hypothetical protein